MAKKKISEPLGRPPFDEDQKMERVTIGLPGPILNKLKKEAIARNISFSLVIREYLRKTGIC